MNPVFFHLKQIARRLWFLPLMFSLAAVATIALAFQIARYAPENLSIEMPSEAVVSVLTILASSLLTVTVFALSTLVGALSTAAQMSSPRAVPLIAGDRRAQTSISIFIGAFLYSVVGIIGLSAGVYSQAGRLLLFLVTLGVVVLVIAALIRWIGQISALGRVGDTIEQVEDATREAFEAAEPPPRFGCGLQPLSPAGTPLFAKAVGYVQHIDTGRLQEIAEDHDLRVHILRRPGNKVDPARPLALVEGDCDEETCDRLRRAFVTGDARTFDRDPRFGLIVLAEIADRALSPGVNDPGTAIVVIGAQVRVLGKWMEQEDDAETRHDRVTAPDLRFEALLIDAFRPIARDGAGQLEVVLRLIDGLETLVAYNRAVSGPLLAFAQDVEERARKALTARSDLEVLERTMTELRASIQPRLADEPV